VAGGSGANEAKVFDHRSDNAVVGTVTNLQRGIFTVDFAPSGDQVAIAGGTVPPDSLHHHVPTLLTPSPDSSPARDGINVLRTRCPLGSHASKGDATIRIMSIVSK